MHRVVVRGGVLLLVAALYGCAAAVGSGYGQGGMTLDGRTYEEARADHRITAAINTLLVRDKSVSAMDVDVATLNGVVTLTGTVPSERTALQAEALARSVNGVERVVNRLRVGP